MLLIRSWSLVLWTLWLAPQQILLWISSVASLNAIVLGMYGDGLIRSRIFIATDQAPIIVAGILHTIAVISIIYYARNDALP